MVRSDRYSGEPCDGDNGKPTAESAVHDIHIPVDRQCGATVSICYITNVDDMMLLFAHCWCI